MDPAVIVALLRLSMDSGRARRLSLEFARSRRSAHIDEDGHRDELGMFKSRPCNVATSLREAWRLTGRKRPRGSLDAPAIFVGDSGYVRGMNARARFHLAKIAIMCSL
jgi:hypothetical protein